VSHYFSTTLPDHAPHHRRHPIRLLLIFIYAASSNSSFTFIIGSIGRCTCPSSMALKRPRAFTISSSPEDFYTLKSNRSIRHPSPVVYVHNAWFILTIGCFGFADFVACRLIPKPTPERKTKERPRRTTKASAPLQKEQRVPAPIEGTPIPAKGNSKSTAPPWKKRRIVAPIKSTPTPARRKPRVSASFEGMPISLPQK
jgi:hypothetical protein